MSRVVDRKKTEQSVFSLPPMIRKSAYEEPEISVAYLGSRLIMSEYAWLYSPISEASVEASSLSGKSTSRDGQSLALCAASGSNAGTSSGSLDETLTWIFSATSKHPLAVYRGYQYCFERHLKAAQMVAYKCKSRGRKNGCLPFGCPGKIAICMDSLKVDMLKEHSYLCEAAATAPASAVCEESERSNPTNCDVETVDLPSGSVKPSTNDYVPTEVAGQSCLEETETYSKLAKKDECSSNGSACPANPPAVQGSQLEQNWNECDAIARKIPDAHPTESRKVDNLVAAGTADAKLNCAASAISQELSQFGTTEKACENTPKAEEKQIPLEQPTASSPVDTISPVAVHGVGALQARDPPVSEEKKTSQRKWREKNENHYVRNSSRPTGAKEKLIAPVAFCLPLEMKNGPAKPADCSNAEPRAVARTTPELASPLISTDVPRTLVVGAARDITLNKKRKRVSPQRPDRHDYFQRPKLSNEISGAAESPTKKLIGEKHAIHQSDLDCLRRIGSDIDVRVLNAVCHLANPKLHRQTQTGMLVPELILECQPEHVAIQAVRRDFARGKTIVQPLYDPKRRHFAALVGDRNGLSLFDSRGWIPNDMLKLQIWTLCGNGKALRVWTPSVPFQAADSKNSAVYAAAFAVDKIIGEGSITTASYPDEHAFRRWLLDIIVNEVVKRPKRKDGSGVRSMTRPGRTHVMIHPDEVDRWRTDLHLSLRSSLHKKNELLDRGEPAKQNPVVTPHLEILLPGSPISDSGSEKLVNLDLRPPHKKTAVQAHDIFFPADRRLQENPTKNPFDGSKRTSGITPKPTVEPLRSNSDSTPVATKRKSSTPKKRQIRVSEIRRQGVPAIPESKKQEGARLQQNNPDPAEQEVVTDASNMDVEVSAAVLLPDALDQARSSQSDDAVVGFSSELASPVEETPVAHQKDAGASHTLQGFVKCDNGSASNSSKPVHGLLGDQEECCPEKEPAAASANDPLAADTDAILMGISDRRSPSQTPELRKVQIASNFKDTIPPPDDSTLRSAGEDVNPKKKKRKNGSTTVRVRVSDEPSGAAEMSQNKRVRRAKDKVLQGPKRKKRPLLPPPLFDHQYTDDFSNPSTEPELGRESEPELLIAKPAGIVEVREPDSTSSLCNLSAEHILRSSTSSTPTLLDPTLSVPQNERLYSASATVPKLEAETSTKVQTQVVVATKSTNTQTVDGEGVEYGKRLRRSRRGSHRDCYVQCDSLSIMKTSQTETDEIPLEDLISLTFSKVEAGLASWTPALVSRTRKSLSGLLLRAEELLNGHQTEDHLSDEIGSPVDLLDTLDLLL